jgi:hypothetical protein
VKPPVEASPVILGLRRGRQEDGEFQDSPGYTARPHHKKRKEKKAFGNVKTIV